MGENLLAREHAEYFIEKVAEIISLVKVNPEEAMAVAFQQGAAVAVAKDVTTTASTTVATGTETPITSPTTSRKTSTTALKQEEGEVKVIFLNI